jgi:predicted ATP-dependent endonuclease of OLD family
MAPDSYKTQLDKHFSLVSKAKESVAHSVGIPFEHMFPVFDSLRLHTLVEQWQDLQNAQKRTYMPRTEFVKTASDMLFRKDVSVNSSNQVVVMSSGGEPIPVRSLSSGEKQLLIFLGETLLQEQETYIFLADEPELSLHVEWQEELVPNLLKVNPNAQVLFATHSPDIVNAYQENVTKMEKIID